MTNYEGSTKRLPPAMCTYLFRGKMISYELYWWLLLLHLYRVAAVNAWLRDGTASLERGRGVCAHARMYICVQIISNLHFTTVNSSKGIQEANTTSTCFLNLMILVSQQTYNRILRSEPN